MGCGGSKAGAAGADDFVQTLVILRHSERRDQVDPTYLETDEHKAWPFDTPLTENGIKLAHDVADELAEKSAAFSMIVTSPYRRCMQTAAEVAKVLKLPVVIDQEIGEVWDKTMPKDGPPHRSPVEIQAMAKELGLNVKNPVLPEGGFKLFGKVPANYPEDLKDGHLRMLVRAEYYIQESEKNKQNYILVGHAPAIAAMAELFERGACEIQKLDYCATACATRKVRKSQAARQEKHEESVFEQQWTVDYKRVDTGINLDANEEEFKSYMSEILELSKQRVMRQTSTDGGLSKLMADNSSGKDRV